MPRKGWQERRERRKEIANRDPKQWFQGKLSSTESKKLREGLFHLGDRKVKVRDKDGPDWITPPEDNRPKEVEEPVYLEPSDLATHLHIVGATGVGKSKFVEYLCRQFLHLSHTFILIDPHANLYEGIIKYCIKNRLAKKLVLFDPTGEDWTVGYDPLKLKPEEKLESKVKYLKETTVKVWGRGSSKATPKIDEWLHNTFTVLLRNGLSLAEAEHLIIDSGDNPYREPMIENLSNGSVKSDWEGYLKSNLRGRKGLTGTTRRRLKDFVLDPKIKNMVAQKKNTLDLDNIIAGNKALLVNFLGLEDEDINLLGVWLLSEIVRTCFDRGEKRGRSNPVYLVVDDFARFMRPDWARIFDEGRKFGLHFILSHQHLSQLKKVSRDFYHSTLTDARTKVVFGGLMRGEVKTLAQEIYSGKLERYQTFSGTRHRTVSTAQQLKEKVSHLKSLPKRRMVVKAPQGEIYEDVLVPFVGEPRLSPAWLEEVKERIYRQSPYHSRPKDIQREQQRRLKRIKSGEIEVDKEAASQPEEEEYPEALDDFLG